MTDIHTAAQTLVANLAQLFAALPQVEAVALGGSRSTGAADRTSDIDVYVYTQADIPVVERQALVLRAGNASRADLGLTYWGPGDEWVDAATGIEVDVVYFDVRWMENQLQRVIYEHQAQLGYTTCFWRTVHHSHIYYDRHGWFQHMQHQSNQPYSDVLRHNIMSFNHPVLRTIIPSYLHQLEKAVQRQDQVSINHRVAALFASYFDILFALNRILHPGEKRLVTFALSECPKLPIELATDINAVLRTAGVGNQAVIRHVSALLDRLDALLAEEGFDVRSKTF